VSWHVPVEPPALTSAVPDWRPGDTIPLGHKTLRVVGIRDDDAGEPLSLLGASAIGSVRSPTGVAG
jgi:hypothetical protein